MADITPQSLLFTDAALTPSYAAAASGDQIPVGSDERIFLAVTNGGGSSINVTIAPVSATVNVGGVGPVAVPSRVVAVGAGVTKWIGPIPAGYVDQATGKASVSYSALTSVTRAAFRVPLPA